MNQQSPITIETFVNAPIDTVWTCWNKPEHITNWCAASDYWHAPEAENDLRPGGKFRTVMAAKDGSMSFPFHGEYTRVDEKNAIEYDIADGRHVSVHFQPADGGVKVVETFDPENTHPREMQEQGWQAILNNFKKYTEQQS